ncbi:MAG: metal ABC transporter permease [Verrucomicrobia bacterium]|nr:metal ABC transporter permease [Verrucomicrobiota bacterium]
METFHQLLDPGALFHNSVLASIIVGAICPLVGMFFVMRRTIFLGVALPQVSSAGIVSAFWLHSLGIHFLGHSETKRGTALVGAGLFTVLAIVALALLERRGRGLVEGRTGAIYALAAALAILFTAGNPTGEMHIANMLRGEIVAVTDADMALLATAYGAVALVVTACRRALVLVSFDRDVAQTILRRPWVWDLVLYGVFGVTISVGVMIVGPLALFGFLILPALTVLPWSHGLPSLAVGSCGIGCVTAFCGFAIASAQNLPVGPTDVALGFALFAMSSLVRSVARR